MEQCRKPLEGGASTPIFFCAKVSEPVSDDIEPVSALAARPIPDIGKSGLETGARIRASETLHWTVSGFRPQKTPQNVGLPAL